MLDLRYGDVERAMVHAFRIGDGDLKAFRARIRHLRRRGVPDLPQTGSGRQIAYTVDHVRALYMGLRLNQVGMAPEQIGDLFGAPWGRVDDWFAQAVARPELTYFVGVNTISFGGEVGLGAHNRVIHLSGYASPDSARTGFFELLREFQPQRIPLTVINVTEAEAVIQDSLRAVGLVKADAES